MRSDLKSSFAAILATYLLLFQLLPAAYNLVQLVKGLSSHETKTYIVFAEVDAENEKKENSSKSSKSYEEVEDFVVTDFVFSCLLLDIPVCFYTPDEKLQACCIPISTPPPNRS